MLKNRPGLRDQDDLDQYETAAVELRLSTSLPNGNLDADHYRAVHKHIFQDVYAWAGRYREVRIHKGMSAFCYPEHIAQHMIRLFAALPREIATPGRPHADFCRSAAHFASELNAIHPFREGNGRAMMAFLGLLSGRAGHPLDLGRIRRAPYLDAMIAAFNGDEKPLAAQIAAWTA